MKGKKAGAAAAPADGPLISTAGSDHVIFSKKLLVSIAVILIATACVFFWIEQTRIARNVAASKVGMLQNKEVKAANDKLEKAKSDLQAEEDELVNMYSQWLDNESQNLQLSQDQLNQLKSKFKSIQEKVSENSQSLKSKESSLTDQENRLSAYQFKIQQKQAYIDNLAGLLAQANITVQGTALDETPPEFLWDDEKDEIDLSNMDDDWMNDEPGEA